MTFTNVASILPVTDLKAALAFYVDGLEFTQMFAMETYAGIKHDAVELHLSQHGGVMPSHRACLYIDVENVDAWYAHLKAKGIETKNEPHDEYYGMREFEIEDADGNKLYFATEIKK